MVTQKVNKPSGPVKSLVMPSVTLRTYLAQSLFSVLILPLLKCSFLSFAVLQAKRQQARFCLSTVKHIIYTSFTFIIRA